MTAKLFYEKTVKEIDNIEQPAQRWMRARGWIFEKLQSLSRNGWPDRCAIKYGLTIWVELKAPGKRPEKLQEDRHAEIRANGGIVVWFDNLDAFKAYFRNIDEQNSF
ncbi:VRR-NUC domain protein [compost metagenome]